MGKPLSALLLAILVLLAGCGDGGQPEGGSQDGGGNAQQGGGNQANGDAPEKRIALGRVVRVNPDNERRIALRPNTPAEGQEDGPMVFKIRKNANVVLTGQPAEVGDISEGQQAQVEYVVKNDLNRAVSVELFKAGGQDSGGQPSGGEGTSN